MQIDEEIKNAVIELIRAGEERKANLLLVEKFQLSNNDASRLVDSIKTDFKKRYRLHTVKSLKRREEIKSSTGCFKFLGAAIFAGAAILALGFYLENKRSNQIKNSQIVPAMVLDNKNPTVLLYNINGKDFLYEFKNSSNDGLFYNIGDPAEIYVSKNDPNEAILNSDYHLWSLSRGLKVIGAVPFGLGLFLVVLMLYKKPKHGNKPH